MKAHAIQNKFFRKRKFLQKISVFISTFPGVFRKVKTSIKKEKQKFCFVQLHAKWVLQQVRQDKIDYFHFTALDWHHWGCNAKQSQAAFSSAIHYDSLVAAFRHCFVPQIYFRKDDANSGWIRTHSIKLGFAIICSHNSGRAFNTWNQLMVSVQESAAELSLQAGWKQTEETGTILGFSQPHLSRLGFVKVKISWEFTRFLWVLYFLSKVLTTNVRCAAAPSL